MKFKKTLALLSCAALTAVSAVPSFAAEESIIFQSDSDTSWYLQENANDTGSASVNGTEFTGTGTNKALLGDIVTLTIPEDGKSDMPVQVRPVLSKTLTAGTEYDFSVNYTAHLTRYTKATSDNVVYMKALTRYTDSSKPTEAISGIKHKSGDTDDLTSSGTLTGTLTPSADGTLEIQLYLRNAIGSVTFSDLKVSTTVQTTVPETAVASIDGAFYDNVYDALEAVKNNDTIELIKDSQLSDRGLLGKTTTARNITINGKGHTITAPDGQNMALEVAGGYNLTLKNTVVTGGSIYSINVKSGGTLNLIDSTIGTSDKSAKPAINIAGTVNASGTTVINSILFGSTSNKPVIDLSGDAKLTGTIKPLDSKVIIDENYQLITGNTANCTAVYSNSTITDYELVNGEFVKKAAEITMTPAFIGAYTGDSDGSEAIAYRAAFRSSADTPASLDVSSITWKLDDSELSISDTNETSTITLNSTAEVVYGIIISGTSTGGTLSAVFN
ncbi:MAG: hypothetical protein Q4G33_03525 [bacterium]|nr:hypothetical protein [bacterium]